MTCPRCSFDQADGRLECAACGVVFAKIADRRLRQTPLAPRPRPPLLEPEVARTLLIGLVMAALASWTPYLSFVFGYLLTLVHELGHCATGWVFGYASIPAFDFLHGGGVTIHQDRSLILVAIVYAGLAVAFLGLRTRRKAMMALSLVAVLYTFAASTRLHQMLQLLMGHGAELIFAGIFLYRALSGEKVRTPAERPLYAFAGLFILLEDIRFFFGLMTSHARRVEYQLAKGGGSWMDLSRIAEEFLGTDLARVAGLLLICCFLPPLLSYLLFRNRETIRRAVGRVMDRDRPATSRPRHKLQVGG